MSYYFIKLFLLGLALAFLAFISYKFKNKRVSSSLNGQSIEVIDRKKVALHTELLVINVDGVKYTLIGGQHGYTQLFKNKDFKEFLG